MIALIALIAGVVLAILAATACQVMSNRVPVSDDEARMIADLMDEELGRLGL